MITKKLSLRFVISNSKINKRGLCPISCRLTYNYKRKAFSTGIFTQPKNWDAKKQLILSNEQNSDYLNAQISLIKQKINHTHLSLQLNNKDFTVDDIYTLYKGRPTKKEYNFVDYFKDYLNYLSKLIGKDIKEATYKKFYYVCNDIESFIKFKYQKNDLPLSKLNLDFLESFEYYLKTEKQQKQITINKAIQRLRKPIKKAISEGFITVDPFLLHKYKTVRKEVIFLTNDELTLLEKHKFSQERLAFIKDLFIFSCYTGLAYNEIKSLSVDNIIRGYDKKLWIIMKREKTQKEITVPLLPKAINLIEKYQTTRSRYIFTIISNQKYNSYLKEIAAILGIKKRLTTHTARKTFASTILLYNDVPMEIVSELLGHSSIKVTQESYGKIVRRKVSEHITILGEKLNDNI